MNNSNKYSKVIKVLRENEPALDNKEKLTDEIMRRIIGPEEKLIPQAKFSSYLFGWTEIGWIRGAMGVAAVLIIGVFIIQQLIITDRINSLEKQLIRTVHTINNHEPDLGIMQKVMFNIVTKDHTVEDSITISRSDLEELLDSYMELEENYETIKQDAGLESFFNKIIKRNLKEKISDDESEL